MRQAEFSREMTFQQSEQQDPSFLPAGISAAVLFMKSTGTPLDAEA